MASCDFSWLVVASPCRLHHGVDVCAFTAMMNKTFNTSIPYKDFEIMNEATSMKLNQRINQIANSQEATLKIQNPMTVMMMTSLLLQARNKNQV
jgi:hypothetical protein